MQSQLLDSLYGVERGLRASGEVKAEIGELIVKLEANNPTPAPNQVPPDPSVESSPPHMQKKTDGTNKGGREFHQTT